MTKNVLLAAAVALIVAGFVLIMLGLGGRAPLWQIGLAAIALAMLASLATRLFKKDREETAENEPAEKKDNADKQKNGG